MIKINLLPEEFRVVERTSPANLSGILIGTALFLISLSVFMYVHFHELLGKQQEMANLENELASLQPDVKKHTTLTDFIKIYQERDIAVETVKSSRIFFSKKLFELSEIIYSNNHPVWFEDFNITLVKPKKKPVTRGKQAAATPQILSQFNWQFNSVCLSNTVRQATSFYQDIKNNQNFMKDFIAIQIPRFTREEFDQQVGWRFTMGFIMAILQQEESSKTKK